MRGCGGRWKGRPDGERAGPPIHVSQRLATVSALYKSNVHASFGRRVNYSTDALECGRERDKLGN